MASYLGVLDDRDVMSIIAYMKTISEYTSEAEKAALEAPKDVDGEETAPPLETE